MPAETYTGQPCRHCGGTQRYRSNRHCTVCVTAARTRALDIKRDDPIYRYSDQLRNRRRKALKRREARTNG